MNKSILTAITCLVCLLNLAGCGGGDGKREIEVGYQPPIVIPIRVSVNSQGEIKLGLSGAIVTPAGTFDVDFGTDIFSLRNQYNGKVLIVRIDDQVVVYELEEGKEFKVNFDDNNTLYRKVALIYESDGDIILELESAEQAALPSAPLSDPLPEPTNPPTNAPAQSSLDPEDFIRDYFYMVTHQRNYEYTWTLMTDAFKSRNSPEGFSDYVKFWNSVDRVDLNSISFYETTSTSAKCQVQMVLHINGKEYSVDAKYHLIFDAGRQTWIFD